MDEVVHKLGFLFTGILILGGLVMLVLLVFAAGNILSDGSLQGNTTKRRGDELALIDGPNVVADSMSSMTTGIGQVMHPIGSGVGSVFGAIGTGVTTAGKFVGNALYTGVTGAIRGIATGIVFVINVPGNILGFFTNTSASALIQPSGGADVPVISAHQGAVLAAHTPTTSTAGSTRDYTAAKAVWPIHGRVTTLFGVPHWPYQPTHTGLDISSGRASGITPVKPFKPGRVIDVVHAAYGLGNHVVVDHGGGVTSVYAHLHSISARVGQKVDRSTTLGREGSTGASTGTHLHFEIRQNGHPTNPQQYVPGGPHP